MVTGTRRALLGSPTPFSTLPLAVALYYPLSGFYASLETGVFPNYVWKVLGAGSVDSFRWELSSVPFDDVGWDVGDIVLSQSGIVTENYTPADHPAAGTYYWRVVAIVGAEETPSQYRTIVYADPIYTRLSALPDSIFFRSNEVSGIYLSPDHEAKAEGRELLIDGNMEAIGTSFYTAVNNAALSKQGSAHSGTQCLRVAYNGTNDPSAAVSILTLVGGINHITGWFRGDGAGTVLPRIIATGTGAILATGTNSNTWQFFELWVIAAGTTLIQLRAATSIAGYAEFDDISVKQVGILPSSAFPQGDNPGVGLDPELVRNGGFDWDVVWFKSSGATIAGGVAVFTAVASGAGISQAIPIIIGRSYDVTYTITITAGNFRVLMGSTGTGITRTASGTYTETITCAGDTTVRFQAITSALTGTIDNVSVVPTDGKIIWNGDFETPAAITDWTAIVAGTPSIDAVIPYEGTNCFRITRTTNNNPSYAQIVTKIGSTYLLTIALDGSGGATARVGDGATVLQDHSAAGWQLYSLVYTAANTSLRLTAVTSTGTQYARFDVVSLVEIDPLSLKVSGATINQASGNPLLTPMVGHDGVSDGLFPASIGVLNSFCDPTQGFTVSCAYSHTSGVSQTLFRYRANSTNYLFVLVDANGDLVAEYMAGGTAAMMTLTPSLAGGSHMLTVIVDIMGDLLTLVNDGGVVGVVGSLGIWAGNFDATVTAFGVSNTSFANAWNGLLGHFLWQNDAISVAEAIARHQLAGVA